MGFFSRFSDVEASIDASELLATSEQDECDFAEEAKEKVPLSARCKCLKRCCCCFWVSTAVLALVLSAVWKILTWTPPVPTMTGTIPADPFFIKHLGGFCFGRHRIEDDSLVGGMAVEFFKDSGEPWAGQGELYLLAFDDEPWHWGAVSSEWNSSAWSRAIAYANGCREILFLREANGTQTINRRTMRVKLNIHEKFTRQWNLVLVGLGLQLEPALVGKVHYKITSDKARMQWNGRDNLGSIPPKCPPDVAEWSKEIWHDYVLEPLPRENGVQIKPMAWILDRQEEAKPAYTTPPPEEDARKKCHGFYSK
jgi:hypothetical protein